MIRPSSGLRLDFSESRWEDRLYAEVFWDSVRRHPNLEAAMFKGKRPTAVNVHTKIQTNGRAKWQAKEETQEKDKSQTKKEASEHTMKQVNEQTKEQTCKATNCDPRRPQESREWVKAFKPYIDLRLEDRQRLLRRQKERIEKEAISVSVLKKRLTADDIEEQKRERERKLGEAYSVQEMYRDIELFEKKTGIQYPDSDDDAVVETKQECIPLRYY